MDSTPVVFRFHQGYPRGIRRSGNQSHMPTVARRFSVTAPPPRVVDYLKDFGNTEEWDPGTQTCTSRSSGAGRRRSQLAQRVQDLRRNRRADVHPRKTDRVARWSSSATTSPRPRPTPSPSIPDESGSRLTYRADLEMKGAAKVLNPVMKLVFEKLANDTEKQLSAVLNRLGGRSR